MLIVVTKNFYELLGVNRQASRRQIRDAYRTLARTLHPDTRYSGEANSPAYSADDANKMAQVNDAWFVLSDSARRQEYDRSLGFGRSGTEPQAVEYEQPIFYSPSPFPWKGMLALLVAGVVAVLVFGANSEAPTNQPDQLLQSGSCVVFDGPAAVSEVSCATKHDAVVRQLIGYDMTCPSDTESFRDRQGMGTACIDRVQPLADPSNTG